ncbi:MAG: (2Fe-2S)-binding protein, partial [Bdellovibrionales bacterium]|nr:(2Fe-2S)-binding protein [Bdellovibrionales bacterium]
MKNFKFKKKIPGREELSLELSLDGDGNIKNFHLKAVGSLAFLRLIEKYRKLFAGPLTNVHEPEETNTGALLLREAILTAKGQWLPPYKELQLCHCRSIPTEKVMESILIGANTTEKVSRMTSASTACGTCMPDVQAI